MRKKEGNREVIKEAGRERKGEGSINERRKRKGTKW